MSDLDDRWRELRESLGLERGQTDRWSADVRDMPAPHRPGPYIDAKLYLGDQTVIEINHALLESFEVNQDFVDATVFGSPEKTYLTGSKTFTIRGRT